MNQCLFGKLTPTLNSEKFDLSVLSVTKTVLTNVILKKVSRESW